MFAVAEAAFVGCSLWIQCNETVSSSMEKMTSYPAQPH